MLRVIVVFLSFLSILIQVTVLELFNQRRERRRPPVLGTAEPGRTLDSILFALLAAQANMSSTLQCIARQGHSLDITCTTVFAGQLSTKYELHA